MKSRKPGVKVYAVEPTNSPILTQHRNHEAIKPGFMHHQHNIYQPEDFHVHG